MPESKYLTTAFRVDKLLCVFTFAVASRCHECVVQMPRSIGIVQRQDVLEFRARIARRRHCTFQQLLQGSPSDQSVVVRNRNKAPRWSRPAATNAAEVTVRIGSEVPGSKSRTKRSSARTADRQEAFGLL
jgi:hypothetical protein